MLNKLDMLVITLRSLTGSVRDEEGATAVEYGLLVALIAAVIVAMVALVGQDVLQAFTTVEGALPGAPAAGA